MKLGIMQPYLFPYVGYFQLMYAVDTFVIYDDVQYIDRGWINRNRILVNKQDLLCSFSVSSDSQSKNINERFFAPQIKKEYQKFIKTLQIAYGNAPYFKQTKEMVIHAFEAMNIENIHENIAAKIYRSLCIIADFLDLDINFLLSSEIKKGDDLTGQDRIITICSILNADMYINPINGRELYNQQKFQNQGIELYFINSKKAIYEQFSEEFIPWLSIIDVCMFNNRKEINRLLTSYSLIQ